MPSTTYFDETFGVRAIGLRTDNTGSGVTPDLTAEEDRFESADIAAGYVTPAEAFEVVEATVWDVTVGSLATDVDVYAVTGTAAGQGTYLVRMDQAGDTLTIAAADPTDPRKDEIYLVVADNDYDAGTESLPRLAVRGGDAAPSPSAPGVDSEWKASVLLATIDIPASAADITACTITDERAMSQLIVDAPTLEGFDSLAFSPASHDHGATYADIAHVGTTGDQDHALATTSAPGFLARLDKSKLDAIETGADVNQTNAEMLTDIKTVDGTGSLIDADLLDGSHISTRALSTHDHYDRYYSEAEEFLVWDNKANVPTWVKVKKAASAQSIPNATMTDITLDTEIYDDWGGHTGTDARVNCDDDGLYYIEVQVQFGTAALGTYRHVEIYHAVDGTIAAFQQEEFSGGQPNLQVATVYRMASGEGVKIRVKHDYGSAINIDTTNTWLAMIKLGGQLP